MRPPRRWSAVAALCVFGGGCTFDFAEPQVREIAQLRVHIFVREPASEVTFFATLDPGTTADGTPREVPDDSLRLGSLTLPPSAQEGGIRSYRIAEGVSLQPGELLLIHSPRVVGLEGEPPLLDGRVPGAPLPDTLFVDYTEPVELPLIGAAGAEGGSWRVSVSDRDGQEIFSLRSEAPPGDTLRLPGSLLPLSADGGTLELQIILARHAENPSGDYELRFIQQLRGEWPLRKRP